MMQCIGVLHILILEYHFKKLTEMAQHLAFSVLNLEEIELHPGAPFTNMDLL